MLLRRWGPLVAALVATIVLGLGASLGASAAQGTTNADNHPAHIHTGSCAQLGDVEFPLGNVGMMGMMGGGMMGTPGAGMMMTPGAGMMMGSPQVGMMGGMMGTPGAGMAMGPMMGAATAVPVETSMTVVNTTLQHLLGEPHAINIHESAANIQHYIACGDIGGQVMTGPGMLQGGALAIGLNELNNSGESGIAILVGQGNQTQVWLFLAKGLSGTTSGASATPSA